MKKKKQKLFQLLISVHQAKHLMLLNALSTKFILFNISLNVYNFIYIILFIVVIIQLRRRWQKGQKKLSKKCIIYYLINIDLICNLSTISSSISVISYHFHFGESLPLRV